MKIASKLGQVAMMLSSCCATLASGNRCAGCSRASVRSLCELCLTSLRRSPVPQEGHAAFYDQDIAARIVRCAKYGHWRSAGPFLASMMIRRIPRLMVKCGSSFDVVTCVPADRARSAKRGGYLPERLARALSVELGVPFQNLLERDKSSTSQRGLGRTERFQNVAGVYRVHRRINQQRLAGIRVLIVDDICTTGATLASTSGVLSSFGAEVMTVAVNMVEGQAVEFPQDARNICSGSVSTLPIWSGRA